MLAEPAFASLESRVRLLRSMPELAAASETTLVTLAADSRFRRFEAGASIWGDGQVVTSVLVVIEGSVEITRRNRQVFTAARWDIVGIVPVLAGESDGISARAATTALALEIPAEAITSTLERDFAFLRTAMSRLGTALLARRRSLPLPETPLAMGQWRSQELTVVERIVQLRKTPLGQSNLDALAELARSVTEVRFGVGHVIWEAGDSATHWIRLDYGHVRCEAPSGEVVVVGAGYSFGLLDALANETRAYTTRAETEIIALKIELIDWLTILELHLPLAKQILRFLSRALLAE
jgi:CRP-like cAMP-binding protein